MSFDFFIVKECSCNQKSAYPMVVLAYPIVVSWHESCKIAQRIPPQSPPRQILTVKKFSLAIRIPVIPLQAKVMPRCEVSVRYTQGRLGGHTLKFLQPISEKEELLCMECLKPCAHEEKLEVIEAFTATDGEKVTHRSSATESDLFCSGSCRGRFFGKRNGSSLRRQLFDLERGVCQKCGVDCHDLWQTLVASSPERRKRRLEDGRVPLFFICVGVEMCWVFLKSQGLSFLFCGPSKKSLTCWRLSR